MNLQVKLNSIKTINELSTYWTNEDYKKLLEEFNFEGADQVSDEELKDMLYMAITDYEPDEAAAILLTYKLSEVLKPGQIQNLSHEMMDDKVAEEYADPSLHYDLFNINQLLFHAFNGKFPNTEATIISLYISGLSVNKPVNKEILLKSIQPGLAENSLVNRLYKEQLIGKVEFDDAVKIIWNFTETSHGNFEVLSSNYFMEKEDFDSFEYKTEICFYE